MQLHPSAISRVHDTSTHGIAGDAPDFVRSKPACVLWIECAELLILALNY
jgi:hypothetical protein